MNEASEKEIKMINQPRREMETFVRYRLMLSLLPRHPQKITVKDLHAALNTAGPTPVTRRTVERDLEKLSDVFSINCDEFKPAGWYWMKEAPVLTYPDMDVHTALSFRLVDRFMKQIFPRTCLEYLQPHIDQAENVLNKIGPDLLNRWHEKVRILPKGQHLLPAQVEPSVLDAVYEALLTEKRITGTYRRRGEDDYREIEISPLGLVFEDGVICLVGAMWEYDNVVQVLLHRFSNAKVLDKPLNVPADFSLEQYLRDEERNFPTYEGDIRLVVRFDKEAAHHLQETPLSADQVVTEEEEELVVKATVKDTAALRWWILGFGDLVEVTEPESLRTEIAKTARSMARMYKTSR